MEFEDIREALDALFGVNDRRTTSRVKDTETSLWRDQTSDDLKEFNLGALTYIADTLGMSDLYLNRERWKKEQKKSPISKETGLSQNNNLISIESNIAHLASLFELASAQAAQLNNTLHQINQFKLKIDIKK